MNEEWVVRKIQEASAGGDFVRKDPESAAISFVIGTTGEAVPPRWGDITGNIRDQEDITAALDSKVEKSPGSPDMKFGADEDGVFIDIGGTA